MPTTYKAIIGHRPIEWAIEIERIQRLLRKRRVVLTGLAFGDRTDRDTIRAFTDRILMLTIKFIGSCSSRPLRTPNKLRATLKRVAKKPQEFVGKAGAYDPEVVNLIYAALCKAVRRA